MKRDSPSVARNKDAILGVLRQVLPERGTVLEIASGSGQHAIAFAPEFPDVVWQPSDVDPDALASINAWRDEAGCANLREPIRLDVMDDDWGLDGELGRVDAIVCINMVHISPWAACEALLAGAACVLRERAPLYLYGAYFRQDRPTAPSNTDFDHSLRARNPQWGVRWLEHVVATARGSGLDFDFVLDMPNNNYSVVFRRS